MDEEDDTIRLKRNPSLFKKQLDDFPKQVADIFSKKEFKNRPNEFLLNELETHIVNAVKVDINYGWNKSQIEERVKELVNKSDQSVSNSICYRPKTGAVNTTAIEGYGLKLKIEMLEKEIAKSEAVIKEKEEKIKAKRDEYHKLFAKIGEIN